MRRLNHLLALAVLCASVVARADFQLAPKIEVDGERLSAAILEKTNQERQSRGLRVLKPDTRLAQAADGHLRLLVLLGWIQHDNVLPGRETVWERVRAEGVRPKIVSENLARIPLRAIKLTEKAAEGESLEFQEEASIEINRLAALVVDSWMNSPGHRANLLNPKFTHLGCAVETGRGPASGSTAYSAQVFAEL